MSITTRLDKINNETDLSSAYSSQKSLEELFPIESREQESGLQTADSASDHAQQKKPLQSKRFSQTAFRTARTGKQNLSSREPLPKKKPFINRVTNVRLDAQKFSNEVLARQVRTIIDADVVEYMSNPWRYLVKTFFPGRKDKIHSHEMNEVARKFSARKNFTALNFKLLEHPDLQGWVIKGNTSQVSYIKNAQGDTGNNRYDHLNRVRMSQILREAAEEEGLLFGFPETYLIDSEIETDDPEKRYILVAEKLPIMKPHELVAAFQNMSCEQQQLYAEHLCRLIVKTGYSDAQTSNLTLHNGKLYIFDEEPMGLLVDQSDRTPSFDRTLDQCAAIGLQRVIDTLGNDVPIFRVVAENTLAELHEKWVDTPTQRRIFRDFIAIMQNSQATTEGRIKQFRKLDPLLQRFLGSVVAQNLQQEESEKEKRAKSQKTKEKERDKRGLARILEQPEILTFLSSRSGVDVLRQIDMRYLFQTTIEALAGLKEELEQENPSVQRLKERFAQLKKLLIGNVLFKPLEKKIFSLVESIKRQKEGISDKELFKELCVQFLHTKIPGSHQYLLDDLMGMLRFLKRDYSFKTMSWRLTRTNDPRLGAFMEPTPARPVAKKHVRAERFPQEVAGKKLNILMVAYECAKFGLKFGGLGEAVYGMAKGFAQQGHHVTILTPKFDKLPAAISNQLTEKETVEHPYLGKGKKDRVLGFEQEGVSLRYLEDTRTDEQEVDHYAVPDPKQIYTDGVLADKDEAWYGLKKRMAYFSSSVAEYIAQHKEDLDVTLCHDWHSAYAVDRIAHRYFNEWSQGKMPAFVFVIHNNNYGCQGIYSDKTAEVLPMFGDSRPGMNVMLDAMALSDQVVTVSPSFAREIQQPILGAGIDPQMRCIAHQNKLSGVLNGSNPDIWNPADNEVLKNWVDPVTKDPLPLNYSADDEDIVAKKALIKEQLQKALEVHYPEAVEKYRLNVRDKDLLLYVGRYDSSQKGLDKFKVMMRAAHERDTAFVTMGIGEDPKASEILDALEKEGEELGNVWVTRGKSDGFSVKMQMGDKERGIPGLGPLFRAAAMYSFSPSSFEPCGLVQFESWLFGTLFIGTATGGLADTVTQGPGEEEFNGFTFERLADWHSQKQDELIYSTTLRAIDFWQGLAEKEKIAFMQKVMKDAQLSSWTTAPRGLTPIQQYEKVVTKAIDVSKSKRGIKGSTDLTGFDEPKSVKQDHYFGKGSQIQLYNDFGAHITRAFGAVTGVRFRVMAPEAKLVNLIIKEPITEHTFNERRVPMTRLEDGSWEVNDDKAGKGTIYEYEITEASGRTVRKADPFAFGSQRRPQHASVVADKDAFEWSDQQWMERRKATADQEKPVNIYEIHVSSWRRKHDGDFMNYREIADELAAYCKWMNYTHVELLGLFEHPSDNSWGYQTSGYFAPTSRCGTIEDFQYLVNCLHEKGIAVLVDFVPYHFAPDEWALREFGGVKFFESNDLYNGESPKWGTRVFDMEREDVRNFLLSSAHFFLSNHVDGLRVDAVNPVVSHAYNSHPWVPNKKDGSRWNVEGIQFLRDLNTMVHSQFKGAITVAENSGSLPNTKVDTDPIEKDGLGFDLRWNLEWMQRTFKILKAPLKKRSHQFKRLVGVFKHHWQMKNVSSISHDEVVHGKGSLFGRPQGNPAEKLAQARLTHAFKAFFPANGVLTFMGTEFAQQREWRFQDQIDWDLLGEKGHRGVLLSAHDINEFYIKNKSLWSAGTKLDRFEWIAIDPVKCIMSYHRRDGQGKQIAIIHNFSNKSFKNHRFTFQHPETVEHVKKMKVVLNTDNKKFGGKGKFDRIKRAKIVRGSDQGPEGGKPKAFTISVPALSTIVLEEEMA